MQVKKRLILKKKRHKNSVFFIALKVHKNGTASAAKIGSMGKSGNEISEVNESDCETDRYFHLLRGGREL